MHIKYKIFWLLLTILLTFNLLGCQKVPDNSQQASQSFFAMDTVFTISLPSEVSPNPQLWQKLEAEVKRIESLTSRYTKAQAGNLADINQNAHLKPVSVDKELWDLLNLAWEWTEKTDGAFSIALGPLTDIWQNPEKIPPTKEAIANTLLLCDYRDIQLNPDATSIYFTKSGMSLDLGGIAKGYALDRLKEILISEGITSAYIDGGGSVMLLGSKAPNQPWKIGLAHPRNPQGLACAITPDNQAVITSGDYQRYFEYKGTRYHHILDGTTGYPANKAISATVIAPNATLGDILSTATFVLGAEGIKDLDSYYQGLAIIDSKLQVRTWGNFNQVQAMPWADDLTYQEK